MSDCGLVDQVGVKVAIRLDLKTSQYFHVTCLSASSAQLASVPRKRRPSV
jgi:hypothetical protein